MRLHPSPLVLASAVCCQFLDQLGVVLKNEARTGVDGLSTTEFMAVDQVQVQQHDGHVALRVLLLIDSECEISIGDRLNGFAGQVDGANHDVATDCLGGRLRGLRCDVGVESEHRVDVRVSLELGLDLGLAWISASIDCRVQEPKTEPDCRVQEP